MVERLQMVFERLTADGNSFFNDEGGFDRAERVAFDRSRYR